MTRDLVCSARGRPTSDASEIPRRCRSSRHDVVEPPAPRDDTRGGAYLLPRDALKLADGESRDLRESCRDIDLNHGYGYGSHVPPFAFRSPYTAAALSRLRARKKRSTIPVASRRPPLT